MPIVADKVQTSATIRTDLGAIFISLELSRSTWLITSLSPGSGEKMSKHLVRGGDVVALLQRFSRLREMAERRTRRRVPIVLIQEAGLDGFRIHRTLEGEGIESHVVDAASMATSRRRRRVKTDRIDGEALVRALLAFKRGEPRVCARVRVPTPAEEDRRRVSRERKTLTAERVGHVNRIKGRLFSQGIEDEPLHRNRRTRLEELQTGDGRPLPEHLKRQISRELDRLEEIMAGHRLKAQVDAALLAATDLVHGSAHIVVNASPRHAAKGPEGVVMGIEQHLMRLQQIGADNEGAAVAELGMCHLQLDAGAANDCEILAPVELKGFAGRERQRHKGATPGGLLQKFALLLPGTGTGGHPVVGSVIAEADQVTV